MAVATGRRHGRVSETLVRRIQKQISSGKLLPGEKLPAEREMARKYRTSRVSVREAYRSLEEMGLISIRRGAEGGGFISDVDHVPVLKSLSLVLRLGKTTHEELTEARLLVEPPIARLAARRAQPEDVARLEIVVRKQEASLKRTGDYGPFDLQFHRSVADCARNLPLKVLMNSLADLMVQIVSKLEVSEPVQHETCNFHRLILDAITRHDEDAAYAIMADHVAEVQDRLVHLPPVPVPPHAREGSAPAAPNGRG